eukprot:jgi/Bigna1/144932/aug1.93_g19640
MDPGLQLHRDNVHLQSPTGSSNCGEGTSCVAIVVMAGLTLPQECTRVTQGSACTYLCGVMSHIAAHKDIIDTANAHQRKTGLSYDIVVMHDESIPGSILDSIDALSLRRLPLSKDLKLFACMGMEEDRENHKASASLCEQAVDFNTTTTKHNGEALRMLRLRTIQQMKPAAAALTNYDAVVFLDQDAYVLNAESLADTAKNFIDQDKQFLTSLGGRSPVNAGVWFMKPSQKATEAWLEDLGGGFSEEGGWDKRGQTPQVWPEAIRANPGQIGKKGAWNFVGADKDQGLLWDIFGLKLKSMAVGGFTDYIKDMEAPNLEGVEFVSSESIHASADHITGSPKPYQHEPCRGLEHRDKRILNALKLIAPSTRKFFGMNKDGQHEHPSLLKQCSLRLDASVSQCRESMARQSKK